MFRIPVESVITKITHHDDGVTLQLRRPNIEVFMLGDSGTDPFKLMHQVKLQWGGRHQLHGRAWNSPTRGLCFKRYNELLAAAPTEDRRTVKKARKPRKQTMREREVRNL